MQIQITIIPNQLTLCVNNLTEDESKSLPKLFSHSGKKYLKCFLDLGAYKML